MEQQTNVIASGVIAGKEIQFSYHHIQGSKPQSVGFRNVEGDSSINGTYYSESRQFSVNVNNMEPEDGNVIEGIFNQCVLLTEED